MGQGGELAARKVRVDAWLWAIRLFKTRSQAHAACEAGHVRVRGERAKPATAVAIGDEVRVRRPDHERVLVVAELLVKRVGAAVAAGAYEDHSPPRPPAVGPGLAPGGAWGVGLRDRGSGRPTKAERRAIDKLRGRR
jgi:ribosome-associated heat shock protein Hsp15